jgi:hypothetical protein
MIRLLLRLFGIKDYEVCQSCETLKQQILYERAERQRLTETLLDLVKPKPPAPLVEPAVMEPIKPMNTFSQRRKILEEEDRKNNDLLTNSKNLAMPDEAFSRKISYVSPVKSTEVLEKEVGIETEAQKNG